MSWKKISIEEDEFNELPNIASCFSYYFVALLIANVVVFSTGRIQIGTPSCEIWNSPEGDRCATVKCNGTQPSGSTCYDNSNSQTTLFDQQTSICELRPSHCRVISDQRLACDSGNKSAS